MIVGSAALAEQRVQMSSGLTALAGTTSATASAAASRSTSRPTRPRTVQLSETPATVSPQLTTAASIATQPTPKPRPAGDLVITAPAAGTIQATYVRVGDRVDAGQLLMTFNDRSGHEAAPALRLAIAEARMRAADLETSLKSIDGSIAAAQGQLATPVDTPTPPEAAKAVANAQGVYNEAVAREQRAEALEAHGLQATEELEASQLAVRQAAAALSFAREQAEAKAAIASVQASAARTRIEASIAEAQQRRQQIAGDLAAARDKQRAAEAALAASQTSDRDLTLRAPAGGVVTQLMVAPGDRAIAGSPLVHVTPN